VNGGVLLLQAAIMVMEIPYWLLAEGVLLGFVLVFNGRGIVRSVMKLLRGFSKKNFS
jgi:hypothetical protein